MRVQPGELIAHRYRVRDLLGSGAFGDVLRAEDERLGREVALKLLRAPEGELDPRVWREARAAVEVRHPNLVPVLDMGEAEGGRPFLVFELVPGGDLASRLEQRGPVPAKRVEAWVRDLGGALQALHQHEALHRDVKPGNVLLHEDGRAMLADLGLARVAGHETVTETGAVLGTLAYLAPEVLAGAQPGPEADLYALGCTAYEALTGELWYRAKTSGPSSPGDWPRRLPWLGDLLTEASGDRARGLARLRGEGPAPSPRKPSSGAAESPTSRSRHLALALGAALTVALTYQLGATMGPDPTRTPPAATPATPPAAAHDLGLAPVASRLPRFARDRERSEVLAGFLDPTLSLRTRRLLEAMTSLPPARIRGAPEEWVEQGYLALAGVRRDLDLARNVIDDALLDTAGRSDVPSEAVGSLRTFEGEFDAQLEAFLTAGRASPDWGRAPLRDMAFSFAARSLGQPVDHALQKSLIRGVDEQRVSPALDALLVEMMRVLTGPQGSEGSRAGDTELREVATASILRRVRGDLRGRRTSRFFRKISKWPLESYLDLAFVIRQTELVAAALEGRPPKPVPPELEGRFRLLLSQRRGTPYQNRLHLHLERYLWHQSLSFPPNLKTPAARLVRERQAALHDWLGGNVWGLRWKR